MVEIICTEQMEGKWLDDIGIEIENRQYKIGKYIVDGYNPSTNTIYEFNGDFWHGNPNKYNSSDINPQTKCSFGDLYRKTLNKEKALLKRGYNVISIWESDYKKMIKT